MQIYHNLTRDSWKNALAETQSHHLRAISDNNKQMIDIWDREVTRIQNVLDNWDVLATDLSDD